ncbi:hypothetical protein BGZ61DRAFT_1674 [Ilyonectria robusta]|uniref:uncharacterized protein n=1 Tax=Ilyonectria robusta TaxID=1079257 RepID=UPI001E8DCEB6|nr:uncharacterized protein BGZ61DRAFT_1674 [Ilyonectria robusta]KAH8736726.1 hypothetical protein BGZ61DRAFT_1674 [Ilyonectria robusta]
MPGTSDGPKRSAKNPGYRSEQPLTRPPTLADLHPTSSPPHFAFARWHMTATLRSPLPHETKKLDGDHLGVWVSVSVPASVPVWTSPVPLDCRHPTPSNRAPTKKHSLRHAWLLTDCTLKRCPLIASYSS